MTKAGFTGSFLCLLLPAIAFARLGETEEQLIARFGQPGLRAKEMIFAQGKNREFGVKLGFRQDDWTIECAIIDGRSSRESYQKRGEWTDDHMRTVLNANGQGSKWTEISKPDVRKYLREWRREDGGTAVWRTTGMTVEHPAYARARGLAEAKAKAEAGKIPKI
jgi:hypothetical protein